MPLLLFIFSFGLFPSFFVPFIYFILFFFHVKSHRRLNDLLLTRNPEEMELKVVDSSSGLCDMECFQVTSRRPYWCPKAMKRRCWCFKPLLWDLNSFRIGTLHLV